MCTPRLTVVDWTDDPADLNGPAVSPKGEIWFLCVCHHISAGLYLNIKATYGQYETNLTEMLREFTSLRDSISSSLAVLMCVSHHKLHSGFTSEGHCSKQFTGLDTLRYATQLLLPFVNVTGQWQCVCVCVCVWEREREREREIVILKKYDPTNTTQTRKNKPGKTPWQWVSQTGE
jgi:hypothetical protein